MAGRRAEALGLGATSAMTPEQFAGTRGHFDRVVDAVGAPATVRAGWDAVRRGGTVTVVGAGRPGDEVRFSAYEIFHDDKRLTGSFLGGMSPRRDVDLLADLWPAGRLPVERLIAGTADLGDINKVVEAQRSGEVVRTILTPARVPPCLPKSPCPCGTRSTTTASRT